MEAAKLITTPDQFALWICALIALYATIRIITEPDTLRKLPFLNVFSFAIAGVIALLIPHPLALIAAVAYFVGSTFESNAIASVYAGGIEEENHE
jgi:energy-converting hydrogenase A subunit C